MLKAILSSCLLLLLVAACDADNDASAPIDGVATHFDVNDARAEHEDALLRWDQAALADFTLIVELAAISRVEVEYEAGQVVSVERTGEQGFGMPESVDTLFFLSDLTISDIESGASEPDVNSDCTGRSFTYTYDLEFGLPTSLDDLGPCDDGVSLTATITR